MTNERGSSLIETHDKTRTAAPPGGDDGRFYADWLRGCKDNRQERLKRQFPESPAIPRNYPDFDVTYRASAISPLDLVRHPPSRRDFSRVE